MADEELSNKERAVLFALLAEAERISNPRLRDLVGFTLDGKSRQRLNSLGFVASEMNGRAYQHELTPAGLDQCMKEIAAGRPARAGYLGSAAYVILANLHRVLDQQRLSFERFYRRGDRPVAIRTADQAPAPMPGQGQVAADSGDIESRVRSAYQRLAREPRDWVRLAELRPLLGSAPRDEVDAVLLMLNRSHAASVIPAQNRRTLTPDDEDAAVRIGGEYKHLISIG